jgi:hypothetical protein
VSKPGIVRGWQSIPESIQAVLGVRGGQYSF